MGGGRLGCVAARRIGWALAGRSPPPRSPEHVISALSGGSVQQVILARWLRLNPTILILDEPAQGVDVGAKEDIHRRIEDAAHAEGELLPSARSASVGR